MKEICNNAKKLMKNFCHICPRCNGVACAGQVPGMGGVGTGSSFRANIEALDRIKFNMRLIHDVTDPDTTATILGKRMALPLLAAPVGGVSFNMGGRISEDAYISAIIEGCKAKGVIGCTGDGVPEFIHKSGFEAIKNSGGHGIPFIKPWEDEELYEKFALASWSGCNIVGMDIDAAGLITLRKMGRPVSPKSFEELRKIIKKVTQLPATTEHAGNKPQRVHSKTDLEKSTQASSSTIKFILKGVMTPDEAQLAVEAGADAIVVSNHGGRVLDFAPGAADVLESIADKVKGRITILADGGIRSGGDILKLLALGADAVMIGRPFSVAAMGGLQAGVERYIDTIHQELKQSMVLTGSASVKTVSRSILYDRFTYHS